MDSIKQGSRIEFRLVESSISETNRLYLGALDNPLLASGRCDLPCKIKKKTLITRDLKSTLNDNASSEKLSFYWLSPFLFVIV